MLNICYESADSFGTTLASVKIPLVVASLEKHFFLALACFVRKTFDKSTSSDF
jgi:hypothetical protein